MTDDIVERLHKLHDEIEYLITDRPDEYSVETIGPLAIVVAATTEIETLRTENERIRVISRDWEKTAKHNYEVIEQLRGENDTLRELCQAAIKELLEGLT